MKPEHSLLSCMIVVLLTILAWHYTPWESMGWWGPIGCGEAFKHAHKVPVGCAPPKQPEPCK